MSDIPAPSEADMRRDPKEDKAYLEHRYGMRMSERDICDIAWAYLRRAIAAEAERDALKAEVALWHGQPSGADPSGRTLQELLNHALNNVHRGQRDTRHLSFSPLWRAQAALEEALSKIATLETAAGEVKRA